MSRQAGDGVGCQSQSTQEVAAIAFGSRPSLHSSQRTAAILDLFICLDIYLHWRRHDRPIASLLRRVASSNVDAGLIYS